MPAQRRNDSAATLLHMSRLTIPHTPALEAQQPEPGAVPMHSRHLHAPSTPRARLVARKPPVLQPMPSQWPESWGVAHGLHDRGWQSARGGGRGSTSSLRAPSTAASLRRTDFVHQYGVDIWQREPEWSPCGSRLGPREPSAFIDPTPTRGRTPLDAAGTRDPFPPSSKSSETAGAASRTTSSQHPFRPCSTSTVHSTTAPPRANPVQPAPSRLSSFPSTPASPRRPEPPVPPSILPREFHLEEKTPVPPDDGSGEYAAVWDDHEELWRVTVFPACRPVGREQVGHLRNCINEMLRMEIEKSASATDAPSAPQPLPPSCAAADRKLRSAGGGPNVHEALERSDEPERLYKAVHSIYAAGMHELARQVSAQCAERGKLLVSVWTSAEALRERMQRLREARSGGRHEREASLSAELDDALDKLKNSESLRTNELRKVDELAKLSASREKLVGMVKTLQAALASMEDQLAASQAARKAAEARLHMWLPHCAHYSTGAALEALEALSHASQPGRLEAGLESSGSSKQNRGGVSHQHAAETIASTEAILERAVRWHTTVREDAARLVDWEHPPRIQTSAGKRAVDGGALRMLMTDMERILGSIVCLRGMTMADSSDENAAQSMCKDADDGNTRGQEQQRDLAACATEATRPSQAMYEETISRLQNELAQARDAQLALESQLHAARASSAAVTQASGDVPPIDAAEGTPNPSRELPFPPA